MIRHAPAPALIALLASLAVAVTPPATAQPVAKATFVTEGSFSLPASGPAALERPLAIAWSSENQLHVADENGTVAVFDAAGTYLRSYGGDALQKVAALAVDATDRAYVLDVDERTVLVFDASGALRHRIGSRGDDAGRLDDPLDVAVGPAGLVYILDKGRKGVQVFSRDGTFVHDLLLPLELREPRALAVGPAGRVFVADRETPGAMVVLPPLSEALDVVGRPSPDVATLALRGANLEEPTAVVATPTGTVLVADRESGVVWSADATGGEPVASDDRVYGGRGSGRGAFGRLADAALAGDDELVLLDRDERKVERIRLVLEEERAALAAEDYPVQLQTVEPGLDPGVLATAPTGRGTTWYAMADEEGRNVRVVEAELEDRQGVFGSRIRVPTPIQGRSLHAFGQVVERAGDAALNDTLLVVTEPGENRFHVFDLRTDDPIGSFGDTYSDDRRLRDPRGVALFPDGRIAVADHGNDRIVVFSADVATFLGSFPLTKAEGVTISRDGRMFAWDEDGLVAGEIPLEGGPVQPLPAPLLAGGVGAIATDDAGNLYTLRRQSGRVAIADAEGARVLARVGGYAELERGGRLTVDADGNIYATDLEHAHTVVRRWGVDVPPVGGMSVTWGDNALTLRWTPVPGSFVNGYEVEGAEAADGPWSSVAAVDAPNARVEAVAHRWYRAAARTVTGALGRPSEAVPALHVHAARAFDAGDWSAARARADQALTLIEAGEVRADPSVTVGLRWQGFVSASEAGDDAGVLAWNERLGDLSDPARAFDRAYRLAVALDRMGEQAEALEEALLAIQTVAGRATADQTERLGVLRQMVFDNGVALERWVEVIAVGDALLGAAGPAPDLDFLATLARAHLRAGDPARAMELARIGLDGAPTATLRGTFNVLGFVAAAEQGDVPLALQYVDSVGDSIPVGLFVDFQSTLARLRLAEGDVQRARSELLFLLLGEAEDIRALADTEVAGTALDVFGGMVEAGASDEARSMLDTLVTAMPPDLAEVRAEFLRQADSVAAIADTRAKLGEGFGYFRDALFRDALRFFQEADGRTDLDVDQRLMVKEILAAVFHSLGRLEDADAAFRGVWEVEPDFILADHLAHVEETYGLTIFTEEMVERFQAMGPIM